MPWEKPAVGGCREGGARRSACYHPLPQLGAIAQLVERFHGMEEVRGSIPLSSTPNPRYGGGSGVFGGVLSVWFSRLLRLVTVSFGRFTMFADALPEFRADWLLAGKATSTVGCHLSLLRLLADTHDSPGLAEVRVWVGDASTVSMRRKRTQAVRAFGRWSESIGDNDFPWWRNLPVPTEVEKPQPTAMQFGKSRRRTTRWP